MIHARPFDYPYDGQLDPVKVGLLVIDLQIDYLSADGYFARKGYDPTPLRAIVPNVQRLVRAARDAGCRIIWTRQGYRADTADASAYDKWRAARAGIKLERGDNAALLRGSPGYDMLPELNVDARDIIVDKTANGAFYQTDLELVLRAQGITHLMFSGATTDVCVHTTLREAVDRKYQCLLVADACASCDAYAHEAAIHMVTVEDGIFGVVASTDQVVAGLTKAASR
jgi:nicotinamidase-related amidase